MTREFADDSAADRLVAEAEQMVGAVDILVVNAQGVSGPKDTRASTQPTPHELLLTSRTH